MAPELLTTPYGSPALDALAAAVARAKQGDPLGPITVVVPSNYAGVAVRRALARRVTATGGAAGRSGSAATGLDRSGPMVTGVAQPGLGPTGPAGPGVGVAGLTVVTMYRLAELLAGPVLARSGRVPVSSPVVSTAVRAALAETPGLFRPVADQPSTVEALRRAHRELRDLDGGARRRLVEDARAAAVVTIDDAVTERLRPRWYDETDLMVTAADIATRGSGAAGPIIVHLPQELSVHGARLLRALAEHGPVTVVLGVTGRADAAPARIAERLGLPWPADGAAAPARRPHADATAGAGERRVVERTIAADEDDEVRAALRRVVRGASDGIPLERMAVVYAPGAVYGRLLAEHLAAARLPWNGVTDLALGERVAGRALLALLDPDLPALRRRDVFALLASSPIAAGRPVSSWERLARDAGVVAGREQWSQRLGALAQRRPDHLDQIEGLRSFVATLADLLQPPSVSTWATYATWARALLTHVLGPPQRWSAWPPDEIRAAEDVERLLDRLGRLDAVGEGAGPARGFEDGDHDADLDVARSDLRGGDGRPGGTRGRRRTVDRAVLRAAVDAELSDGLRTVGRLGEGLFVGPIPLAVALDIDLVVVLGLTEGGLPGPLGDDPLLGDGARRRTAGALRTAADRRALLHHQLLAVTAGATTIVASRPLAELRTGRGRSASRWLADLERGAALGPVVRHASFAAGLRPADQPGGDPADGVAVGPPASEQEVVATELLAAWRAGRPLAGHPLVDRDDALRGALRLVDARNSADFTRYDGNLAELVAAGVDLSPATTSPTALEAWATCPYGYFVRHVLGVREPDHPDDVVTLGAAERGVLVHAVLESVISAAIQAGAVPAPGEPWPDHVQEQLAAELAAFCRAAEERGIVGTAVHWRQEQRRLRRRLQGFLALDHEARAGHGVTPAVAEMAFGRETPLVLTLPGGHALTLTGQVDRVDAGVWRVSVIDYKTGSPPRDKRSDDPLAGGRLLQLPIYGLAASQQLGRPDAEVVAEYWYLDHRETRRKRVAVTIDDAVMERLGDVVRTIIDAIAAGIFVPHPDPPDPWRWSRCPYCDPDGADTATLWSQWQRKQADPALAPYLTLVS